MKKLLYSALCLAALASLGCAITDYPVITDTRGDFSGVIRTGHKAYVLPTSSVATIWSDGSDELFTSVYQNNYGDQKLYTFNNFDPSASVVFLDQTYCDWRYEGCEVVRAWNPAQANVDDPFDYEFFPDCSGARSLSLLVSNSSRVGECGDGLFGGQKQALAAEFAALSTTNWRGGTAYIVPMSAENMSITMFARSGSSAKLPIFGQYTAFLNDKLQMAVPVTPNARHELRWAQNWVNENGAQFSATITYGSLTSALNGSIKKDGLTYNQSRF